MASSCLLPKWIQNTKMGVKVITTCLCPAVLDTICEKTGIQGSVNGWTVTCTTGSPICAPELKAVNLLTATYLSQAGSQMHCHLHRVSRKSKN